MREPTIHITRSQLGVILQKVLECSQFKAESLSDQILMHGRKYSMTHRCLVSTNQQLQKKSDRIKMTSKSEAGLFANILLFCRRKAHHRAIQLVKPGSSDWLMLKEICKLATEFSNEFGLPLKEGYQRYIEIGLKKMKLFSLMKYKGLHSSICAEYESVSEVDSDSDPEQTVRIHDYYRSLIAERIGDTVGYRDQPEKYKYFIEVRKECEKLKVGYKFYIKAQFDGLEWAGTFPDPTQLVGLKALERLQKAAFAGSVKLGVEEKEIDFKKIKKNAKRKRENKDHNKQQ